MDRQRFSALAHRTHQFCSPVSEPHLDTVLARAALPSGARAVDYGCGHGGMAAHLATRFGLTVDAVERSPHMAALARERAGAVPAPGRVAVHEASASAFGGEAATYDLALAVGVDALFGGGRAGTLSGLARVVRPGGHVLFGETYWRRRPAPEYLAALGTTEEAMGSHAGNAAAAEAAGLRLVSASEAGEAEWDAYEDRYAAAIDSHLAARPDDPDAGAMRARIAAHRALCRDHGRATLGFGLYLFSKPGA